MILELIAVFLTTSVGSIIIISMDILVIYILYSFFGIGFLILLFAYLSIFSVTSRISNKKVDSLEESRKLNIAEFDRFIDLPKNNWERIKCLANILYCDARYKTNLYFSKKKINNIFLKMISDIYICFRCGILPTIKHIGVY